MVRWVQVEEYPIDGRITVLRFARVSVLYPSLQVMRMIEGVKSRLLGKFTSNEIRGALRSGGGRRGGRGAFRLDTEAVQSCTGTVKVS